MLLTKVLRKLRIGGIIPEPYSLFSPDLPHKDSLSFPLESTLSGVDLFSKVAGYHSANANRTAWKLLSAEQKDAFMDPNPAVNIHLHRIADAYRFVDNQDGQNPYYNAWLYPWEIIKDKLRMRWMFGIDMYDALIIEALTVTKTQVTPKKLWEGEVEWRAQREDELGNELEMLEELEVLEKRNFLEDTNFSQRQLFSKLPNQLKNEYQERSRRKTEYCGRLKASKSARKVPTTPFQSFFKSQFGLMDRALLLQEKSQVIAKNWKTLSEEEKGQYKGFDISAKGRIHREKILDGRTELVMDYIFGGKVVGWRGDWREWRREVVGEMYYLDKIYFPYVLQKRRGRVEMEGWRTEE